MSDSNEHSGGGGSHSFGLETVDHIDTTNFPDAIKSIETMAKAMEDIVTTLDDYKAFLLENWVGKGRNQFEKSYHIIKRKLLDESDITWDMYEKLVSSEEVLLQNDIDVANGIKMYN